MIVIEISRHTGVCCGYLHRMRICYSVWHHRMSWLILRRDARIMSWSGAYAQVSCAFLTYCVLQAWRLDYISVYVRYLSPTFGLSLVIQYYFGSWFGHIMLLWYCAVCTAGLAVLFFDLVGGLPFCSASCYAVPYSTLLFEGLLCMAFNSLFDTVFILVLVPGATFLCYRMNTWLICLAWRPWYLSNFAHYCVSVPVISPHVGHTVVRAHSGVICLKGLVPWGPIAFSSLLLCLGAVWITPFRFIYLL